MSARLAVVRYCNECPHAQAVPLLMPCGGYRTVLRCTKARPPMKVPYRRIPDKCPLPKAPKRRTRR